MPQPLHGSPKDGFGGAAAERTLRTSFVFSMNSAEELDAPLWGQIKLLNDRGGSVGSERLGPIRLARWMEMDFRLCT